MVQEVSGDFIRKAKRNELSTRYLIVRCAPPAPPPPSSPPHSPATSAATSAAAAAAAAAEAVSQAAYEAFVRRLASREAEPLVAATLEFVEAFEHTSPPPEADPATQPDAAAVRGQLQGMEAGMQAAWSQGHAGGGGEGAAAAEAAEVRRGLERYLMERLYPKVFGLGKDVVEDKVLQAQVATLSFVTPQHFGLAPALCESEAWEAAVACLGRLGEVKAPLDKVAEVHAALAARQTTGCTVLTV